MMFLMAWFKRTRQKFKEWRENRNRNKEKEMKIKSKRETEQEIANRIESVTDRKVSIKNYFIDGIGEVKITNCIYTGINADHIIPSARSEIILKNGQKISGKKAFSIFEEIGVFQNLKKKQVSRE